MKYKDIPHELSTLRGYCKANENAIAQILPSTKDGLVQVRFNDSFLRLNPAYLEEAITKSNEYIAKYIEPLESADEMLTKMAQSLL